VIGDEKLVFVSEGVEIEPYVVFNVKAGPVFIDKNVYIQLEPELRDQRT